MKTEYTREELIRICEDAVVPFRDWSNRDSYAAQVNVSSIYEGLKAGVPYTLNTDEKDTIWIHFDIPTKEQKDKMMYVSLDIDDREEYIEWYLEENGSDEYPEMFYGSGIDWDNEKYRGGYLPTRLRLNKKKGDDWY